MQNLFSLYTAQYVIHLLKLWCHHAFLGNLYKLYVWVAPASLYLKVRVIFAMRPVQLYGRKFVFSTTAQYIINMLKLQCHYASLGKLYKLNMWTVLASLYSKVTAILALPCMLCCIFLQDFKVFTDFSEFSIILDGFFFIWLG